MGNADVDRPLGLRQHVTTAEVILELKTLKEGPNADAFEAEICHLVRALIRFLSSAM